MHCGTRQNLILDQVYYVNDIPYSFFKAHITPKIDLPAVESTRIDVQDRFQMLHNVFFHVDRFYAVTNETHLDSIPLKVSKNILLFSLPIIDTHTFMHSIDAQWVPGTTLWIDFPYPDTPDHTGYWMQEFAPIYSQIRTLSETPPQQRGHLPITSVIIPNLRKSAIQKYPWILDALQMVVEFSDNERTAGNTSSRIRLIFWDDLEMTNLSTWIGFERIFHVFTPQYYHPSKNGLLDWYYGFSSPQKAEQFRFTGYSLLNISHTGAAYTRNDKEKHAMNDTVSNASHSNDRAIQITYLVAGSSEPIANNGQVLDALHALARERNKERTEKPIIVRPYSPTSGTPLASLASVMSQTSILIARHGPLLAHAVFLPPHATVIEFLPYNYGGARLLYLNLTRSMGTVKHRVWHAPSSDYMMYDGEEDARYRTWTAEECSMTTCQDAQTRAALIVDIEVVQRMARDAISDTV